MSVQKDEIVGTAGFVLGLLLLLGVATCFSGCWYDYYDERAYLAGFRDGQNEAADEVRDLEQDIRDLQWKLQECLYPPE